MVQEYSFRNLILWQRAQVLALEIIQRTQVLPHSWANAVIVRQIIASATSIAANIAEGHARFTFGAHRNHLSIARGSAAETDNWLDMLYRLGYLPQEEERRLHAECLWLMEALKSKILQLERYEQHEHKRVSEAVELYLTEQEAPQTNSPLWPYVETDYAQGA